MAKLKSPQLGKSLGSVLNENSFDFCRDGFVNTTLRVEKVKSESTKDEDEDPSLGPSSIVYKKYGGNIYEKQMQQVGFRVNKPLVQSLIFYEMSKRAWGPKLYGLFEGGRIEEMVDCHTLTPGEAFTPEFIRDVAKAYARFHSLELPIDRQTYDLFNAMLLTVDEAKKQLAEFIKSKNIAEPDPLACFQRLYDFPFDEEGKWLNSIRSKIKQRTVFCTMDSNYLNRLVRNRKPSDPDATRTLIIDYDSSAYSHRGVDLGGHLVLRMFYGEDGSLQAFGLPYPSESEKLAFLSAYLEEAEKFFDDFDKSALDSLENLVLECEFNALCYVISPCLVSSLKSPSILEQKPFMLTFVDPLLKLYNELKEQFCAKYSHLICN